MSLTPLQNFYKQTVSRRWATTGAGNFYVSVKPTTSYGWLVVNPANSSLREIVKFSATGTDINGDYITIADAADRGLGGTTAQTHEVREPVRMNFTSLHLDEMNTTIDAIVAGGAPDASTTTKGLAEQATSAQVTANTETGESGAPLFVNPSNAPELVSSAITIETTTGTTHSLTTVAGEKVIVWAKGNIVWGGDNNGSATLKYNTVTKDTILYKQDSGSGSDWELPFAMMYTETPGAATQNITVEEADGSTLSNVVIIVMKIKG